MFEYIRAFEIRSVLSAYERSIELNLVYVVIVDVDIELSREEGSLHHIMRVYLRIYIYI